jgi:hypothetical protein
VRRLLAFFPAAGYALAIGGGALAFLVVLAESRGVSRQVGEPIGRIAIAALIVGIVLYSIGVAVAAAIDPAGFFYVRMKPWAQNGPVWARALFAASLAGLLIAVAHYRLSPGTGSALWIALAGAIAIISATGVRRRTG